MTTPRVVIVSRPSMWTLMLHRYGTEGQLRFVLAGRGANADEFERWHHAREAALHQVAGGIPLAWRRTRIDRSDLDRFLFEPSDIVVCVGPDGLVANTAKYLDEQPVIGVYDSKQLSAGVLAVHDGSSVGDVLGSLWAGRCPLDRRTMAKATLDDGQVLTAVNEIFVGHQSHQSARYVIEHGGRSERQSSSGMLVATGTGATGWAASVRRNRVSEVALPAPGEARLSFFVREAWPSRTTGCTLTDGNIEGEGELVVRSEMDEGGVIFADGIESDRIVFEPSATLRLGLAERKLVVVPARL